MYSSHLLLHTLGSAIWFKKEKTDKSHLLWRRWEKKAGEPAGWWLARGCHSQLCDCTVLSLHRGLGEARGHENPGNTPLAKPSTLEKGYLSWVCTGALWVRAGPMNIVTHQAISSNQKPRDYPGHLLSPRPPRIHPISKPHWFYLLNHSQPHPPLSTSLHNHRTRSDHCYLSLDEAAVFPHHLQPLHLCAEHNHSTCSPLFPWYRPSSPQFSHWAYRQEDQSSSLLSSRKSVLPHLN